MKLIKINTDHYVIVDDSEIKEGDWMYNSDREPSILQCIGKGSLRGWEKITHSTNILTNGMGILYLSEVKELLGEVDVEKRVKKDAIEVFGNDFSLASLAHQTQFKRGYYQALEDNKDRKFTEDDLRKIFIHGKQLGLTVAGAIRNGGDKPNQDEWFNESIQSLQPKSKWNIEMVNGKIILL